jgi:N-acetylmuramoyl-L-alanine amidase
MATRVVQQGDCFSSLAAEFGMASWKDLYNLPGNAELTKNRKNPNVLLPGDVVEVPDSAVAKKDVPCATGKDYLFVVQVPKVRLRLVIKDWKGEPYTGKKYEVIVAGNKSTGRTDAAGLIDIPIPATAQDGHLKVWFDEDDPENTTPNMDRDLRIGHLDPVDSVTGVQARLKNLGYACEVTGNLDDATLAAARAYRFKANLPEAGDAPIDDTLHQHLLTSHDGE